MSDDKSISLVNLGKLSKPADTLIKKVSSAVGGIFEPWQIKRVAKAETVARLIEAKAEIEITDLHHRAMHRFVEEEANRQENMEEITKKSLPYLNDESNPDLMEDDWVTNFFDKSRIVSDDEMQSLWAQVLSGEANSLGSFSKRTVNLLSDLGKKDAELFQTLCRFGWIIGDFCPLVFDPQADIYKQLGINFGSLSHLDNLGLIRFHDLAGFSRQGLRKNSAVTYCGQPLSLTLSKDTDNVIQTGKVLLTQAGRELAGIVHAPRVDGFYDYVQEMWRSYIPQPESIT